MSRNIPAVREWIIRARMLADDMSSPTGSRLRLVTFRVLAPTKLLARLNLRAERWSTGVPGIMSVDSIAVARKPIGQRCTVGVDRVWVFVGVGGSRADRDGFALERCNVHEWVPVKT
jgi:hypothetical protein